MECDLSDAIRHVLEALHLGLPMSVNHPSDHRDGGSEGVELLLEPCDRQNRLYQQVSRSTKKIQRG